MKKIMKKNKSRVWLEIDTRRIIKNFNSIRKSTGCIPIMTVLKANAYGLGAKTLAPVLAQAGADRIGVAELKEAASIINKVTVPVQIIGGILENEIADAVKMNLVLPAGNIDIAKKISKVSVLQGCRTRVHILIDTGMGRLGFLPEDAPHAVRTIAALPGVSIEGIYSHYANANDRKHPKTREQTAVFLKVLASLPEIQFPIIHIANSDAMNNFPDTYFNMVRTGINLYGVFDLQGLHRYSLLPTLSLKTRLIDNRILPKGSTVGYGCTHTLKKDTPVGTISAGYADGIPLAASNSGKVIINDIYCQIIGRVSMDYTTVDLSLCPDVKPGTIVTIMGSSKSKKITVEDNARIKNTHPYDIICSLGSRVERVYVS